MRVWFCSWGAQEVELGGSGSLKGTGQPCFSLRGSLLPVCCQHMTCHQLQGYLLRRSPPCLLVFLPKRVRMVGAVPAMGAAQVREEDVSNSILYVAVKVKLLSSVGRRRRRLQLGGHSTCQAHEWAWLPAPHGPERLHTLYPVLRGRDSRIRSSRSSSAIESKASLAFVRLVLNN